MIRKPWRLGKVCGKHKSASRRRGGRYDRYGAVVGMLDAADKRSWFDPVEFAAGIAHNLAEILLRNEAVTIRQNRRAAGIHGLFDLFDQICLPAADREYLGAGRFARAYFAFV